MTSEQHAPLVAFPLASEWRLLHPAAVSEPLAAPLVPARFTERADEVAPAAMKLGGNASAAGWDVDAWFWITSEGVEVSALVLARGDVKAFATWERKPGESWRSKTAVMWPGGKVGITKLGEVLQSKLS